MVSSMMARWPREALRAVEGVGFLFGFGCLAGLAVFFFGGGAAGTRAHLDIQKSKWKPIQYCFLFLARKIQTNETCI